MEGLTELVTECRRLEGIARRFMVMALEADCPNNVIEQWQEYKTRAVCLVDKISRYSETDELKDEVRMLSDSIRQELEALKAAINERDAA